MSNLTLNPANATIITSTVSTIEGATRKLQTSGQALHAGGMKSTDFISPKSKSGDSTASPEMFDGINAAVVAGFTARVQKLLATPTKALQDADKADKRYWQQQIGARRNDFKRALEKIEGKSDDRAPKTPESAEDKIRGMIESIEKIVQNAESLTFDAADFLKDLRALNRKIK